jgi:hypothetical protein
VSCKNSVSKSRSPAFRSPAVRTLCRRSGPRRWCSKKACACARSLKGLLPVTSRPATTPFIILIRVKYWFTGNQTEATIEKPSVADPGCLSRNLIFVHPGSRISVPGSKNSSKREGGKVCCPTFFCSHKYHKTETYFIFDIFELVSKKNQANLQRIIEIFSQQIVINL